MEFAPLFHDGVVLQREMPVPLWGVATPGALIRIELRGAGRNIAAEGRADDDGRWLVRLPPLVAGGPWTLHADDGVGQAVVRDVLVGEVWLASGQSNLEMTRAACAAAMPPADRHPHIRLLTLRPDQRHLGRQQAIVGRWTTADREALADCSAIAGEFAIRLHRVLGEGIPLGIIVTACGGTWIEAWLSREALLMDPETAAEVDAHEVAMHRPGVLARRQMISYADCEVLERSRQEHRQPWQAQDLDDAGWAMVRIPGYWQDSGFPGSGIAWYRRTIDLPPAWRGRGLVLHLGVIAQRDETWINGKLIGATGWEQPFAGSTARTYAVPAALTSGPQLRIAVRVRSHCHEGGPLGPASLLRLHPVDEPTSSVPLAGPWRWRIEQDWGATRTCIGNWGPGNANTPAILFDSRIAPLLPMALRGVLWYQGESNVPDPARYRRLLPRLIEDWRRGFAQASLPFLVVQLPGFGPRDPEPGADCRRAELRDAQAAACALPAVHLAVAIDLGDERDIHPVDKAPVAERLVRLAGAHVHGRAQPPGAAPGSARLASAIRTADGRVQCTFHDGAGLRTRDGAAPESLAIGDGVVWRWARARIDQGTLIAWHEDVPMPTVLRHAWADRPAVNLVAGDDLPVPPFSASLG